MMCVLHFVNVFVVGLCELQLQSVSPVREGGARHCGQLLRPAKHIGHGQLETLQQKQIQNRVTIVDAKASTAYYRGSCKSRSPKK